MSEPNQACSFCCGGISPGETFSRIEADARALWAYRVLARRQDRIDQACGRRPVSEALLIVEATAFVADDATLGEGL